MKNESGNNQIVAVTKLRPAFRGPAIMKLVGCQHIQLQMG